MKTLTAVLFAGGESRRMGTDKATLQIGGEPLWSRQLRVLRELNPEKIMVSARSRPIWCPPEIETVLDQPPSRGPLSGLAAVLANIKTSHALILATDMPQMESAYLHRLWEQCDENCGVIPANENSHEPLCAIYPASAADMAAQKLAGGNYSLQNVISRLIAASLMQAVRVNHGDRLFFINLNTPHELSALKSQQVA